MEQKRTVGTSRVHTFVALRGGGGVHGRDTHEVVINLRRFINATTFEVEAARFDGI